MLKFKTMLFLGCWIVLSGQIYAQTDSDFGKLNISVVVPEEQEGFSPENLSMLENKLTVLLSNSGLASKGILDGIVLYPVIKIYNEREIQAGLQKLTVIDGEMSLFVKQMGDKFIFANITQKMQGSGKSHKLAINNLISSIKTDNASFDAFIQKAKTKALAYYTQKCPSILMQAEQLASVGKQEQAYMMIMGIPAEVPCYEEGRKKAIDIFVKYQARHCAEVILQAKAKFGNNQYKDGFNLLTWIDPTSPCATEANTLFNANATEVDSVDKREFNLRREIINNVFEVEKFRYKAITDMTLLYLATRPREYVYDVVIR
jgi:hypothetical protein